LFCYQDDKETKNSMKTAIRIKI